MKRVLAFLAVIVCLCSTFLLVSCDGSSGKDGASAYDLYKKYYPHYRGDEEQWVNDLAEGKLAKKYNIIYTLATVPPVLAALDSFGNGYETYAMIERGKTYGGIDKIDRFHNVGFNAGDNTSDGFSQEEFELIVDCVKGLDVLGDEFYNIYVQDGTALAALAVAANASLQSGRYRIIVCEDGFGAYDALQTQYVTGKTVTEESDGIMDGYLEKRAALGERIENILSKTDNAMSDFGYDISLAFALASFDPFVYWFQDGARVEAILRGDGDVASKILIAAGFESGNAEVKINLRTGSISQQMEKLSDRQKTDYLTLMYGDDYDATYRALTRTTLADGAEVSDKKLVFIGTRIRSYPTFATGNYGIAAAAETAGDVPETFAALADRYKSDFLFKTESDYTTFINAFNEYDELTASQKETVRAACFNTYINYMFVFKLTAMQYGGEYDILLKGHPREVLGESETWSGYTVGDVDYKGLMDCVITAFHNGDTVGKTIGLLPFGTAAENLAYLGQPLSICGLPSSTYTGYDPDVEIPFILAETSGDISQDGNLSGRYKQGNLFYNENEERKTTNYTNIGNLYLTLKDYYTAKEDAATADVFAARFDAWLQATYEGASVAGGYTVDAQGFLVPPASN